MKKKLILLALALTLAISPSSVFGQSTTTNQARIDQIRGIQAQIQVLQGQLRALKQQSGMMSLGDEGENENSINKMMRKGENHGQIKKLQEFLATDPEIYPEGHKTGYYGPFTEKAVRKFQRKAGLPETGIVDDATRSRINELLTQGAGKSGRIPPGLLRAPGIWKKMGMMGTTTPPYTGTTTPPVMDSLAPVISNVSVTATTASSTNISWVTNEVTTGKVHYALSTPVAGQGGGFVIFDLTLGTDGLATLSNLQASTTYYYYIKVQDPSGNSTTTPDASFITASQ